MQLPLKLALTTFQGFLAEQIPLFESSIYKKRGNPNFSSKWHGLETKPIRLPIAYHDAAIAYCQNLIKGKLQLNDQPIALEPDAIDLLSYDQIRELQEIKELYGDLVAERIRDEMIEEITPKQSDQAIAPNSVTQNLGLAELDPRSILADPKRFQFKMIHNSKTGSSGSLKGIDQWNYDLAGLILVWLDPSDNQTYVINGHNRLSLALRLGIDRIAVKYVSADDHIQARVIGAIANIAEGKGSPLDVANLLRDFDIGKDDLAGYGVRIADRLADHGLSLANLDDCFFTMFLDGKLRENEAIAMGKLDKDLQHSFYELIKKDSRKLSLDVLNELSEIVKSSVSAQSMELNLFGENSVTQNLAVYKAEIDSYILKRLKRDKYLFSIVSKTRNANDLTRGNNAIDTLSSSTIADNAKIAIDIFNQLKNQSGELCKRLNDCALALHNGNNPNQIKSDIYDWVTSQLTANNLLQLAI